MTIKINSPKVVRVDEEDYQQIATGLTNIIPMTGADVGDRLIIKEHTGKRYTGSEVVAIVEEIRPHEITFSKLSITKDKNKGNRGVIHLNKRKGGGRQ